MPKKTRTTSRRRRTSKTSSRTPSKIIADKGRFDRRIESTFDYLPEPTREYVALNMGDWQTMQDIPTGTRTQIQTALNKKSRRSKKK